MIDRKKKLKIIQSFLLILAILIIYLTYYDKQIDNEEEIISSAIKEKVKKQINTSESGVNEIFFNVEYNGLDLNGNRYILKSKEAYLDEKKEEIVYMSEVNAVFYFKDNTVLYISSDKGIYNNKTLNMNFDTNVKAEYLNSKLFAEKAEYSNTENYLSIYGDVRINDIKGNLIADKLFFDITKEQLDITSFNDDKINANVNLNEKRF